MRFFWLAAGLGHGVNVLPSAALHDFFPNVTGLTVPAEIICATGISRSHSSEARIR